MCSVSSIRLLLLLLGHDKVFISFILAVFQCYPNYTPDIIRLSNLPNTFLYLFRHSYMSPNSHVKILLKKYVSVKQPTFLLLGDTS